jgi:hypothetical protein
LKWQKEYEQEEYAVQAKFPMKQARSKVIKIINIKKE